MYCSTTFFMCQSNLSAIRRDVRQNFTTLTNLAETSVRLHMGNFKFIMFIVWRKYEEIERMMCCIINTTWFGRAFKDNE